MCCSLFCNYVCMNLQVICSDDAVHKITLHDTQGALLLLSGLFSIWAGHVEHTLAIQIKSKQAPPFCFATIIIAAAPIKRELWQIYDHSNTLHQNKHRNTMLLSSLYPFNNVLLPHFSMKELKKWLQNHTGSSQNFTDNVPFWRIL